MSSASRVEARRPAADRQPAVRTGSSSRFRAADLAVVALVALVARVLVVVCSDGGPLGNVGYDPSVYYTAADALVHGRMPYADFVLLHPPVLMLVLTPFAFLGSVTSDHLGFVVAGGAFELLGAVNAALVVLVARRAGVGRAAAVTGGLFYALWPGSVGAEFTTRLEPLGNVLLLCGLLALQRAERDGRGRGALLTCGALLGAATLTKIWWVVPLVLVVAATTLRDRRRGALVLAGAAGGMALLGGPFFGFAPAAMWRMVVLDQLGRPGIGGSLPSRLGRLTSLDRIVDVSGPGALLLVPVGAVAVLALVLAWRAGGRATALSCPDGCCPGPDRDHPGRVAAWSSGLRLVVIVTVAQLLVLLAAPTYFGFYADFLAPGASLVVAGAMSTAFAPGWRRRVAAISVGALAAAAVVGIVATASSAIAPFPHQQLAAAVSRARLRCVTADSPMALIELDVLSHDLARGCPNRVDVSGSTYDVDRPAGAPVRRVDNRRWQRDLYRYLTSGSAEIVIRRQTGISLATTRRLDRLPVIVSAGGFTLRRVPAAAR